MPVRPLPNDPSLEHLRKQAKRLQRSVDTGDAAARTLVHEFHPHADSVLATFTLSEAQLVVARGYGFATWTKLKDYLARITPFFWNPPAWPQTPLPPADLYLRLACLDYGSWQRSNPARAARLLAEQPELARASIYTAAATGDVDEVRARLDMEPRLVNLPGGPLQWPPLLYACYSRMDLAPSYSTLEAARLLLARGADPNAGFLWGGTYPFTALTGAFGEGEDGSNQLPHPQRDALARALLEAGADANDSQTLYNRHFRADDDHLELLFAFGLGRETNGPWFRRLGERAASPARLLVEELRAAAKNGHPRRVELLVAHGVDVTVPGLRDGRTAYEQAVRAGHQAIADYLLAHGAKKIEPSRAERFEAACLAGRRDEAHALLQEDPALLDTLGHAGRVDLIIRATEGRHVDGIRLLVELGVDINGMVPGTGLDRSALHHAAMMGDVAMIDLLLSLGADPQLHDPTYRSAPIGWAAHGRAWPAVARLLPYASLFDAVRCDGVERVADLLREDPDRVRMVDDDGDPIVFYLHAEMTRADDMTRTLIAHGADLNARNPAGRTLLDRVVTSGGVEFADLLRRHGARRSAEL